MNTIPIPALKGEDRKAYSATVIAAITEELIGPVERERMNVKPTAWYSLLIKELVQRIANLREMVADPITQDSASASELATTSPDHSQASDFNNPNSKFCPLCTEKSGSAIFHLPPVTDVPESQRPESESAVQDGEQLKLCPFCGSKNLMLPYMHENRDAHVKCNDCGACGPENVLPYGTVKQKHFDKGYALWNTRVTTPVASGHCPSEGLLRGQASSMIFDVFGNTDLYESIVGRNLVKLQQRIVEALQVAHRATPVVEENQNDQS